MFPLQWNVKAVRIEICKDIGTEHGAAWTMPTVTMSLILTIILCKSQSLSMPYFIHIYYTALHVYSIKLIYVTREKKNHSYYIRMGFVGFILKYIHVMTPLHEEHSTEKIVSILCMANNAHIHIYILGIKEIYTTVKVTCQYWQI